MRFEYRNLLVVEAVLKPKKGALAVSSKPFGAEVFLDGDFKGKAPVKIDGVFAGEYSLELRAGDFYMPWTKKVSVEDGRTIEIDAELISLDVAKVIAEKRESRMWYAWSTAGAAVAVGAAGSLLFMKSRSLRKDADRAYQDYFLSITPEEDGRKFKSLDRKANDYATASLAATSFAGVSAVVSLILWLTIPEMPESGVSFLPVSQPAMVNMGGSF